MKMRTFLSVVAVLFAAIILPAEVFAQFTKNTNQSRKLRSVIVGGSGNLIASNTQTAFIGGGNGNTNSGGSSTVGGGTGNAAGGYYTTIGGGAGNDASGYATTISGGAVNEAGGDYAVVGGGRKNKAPGSYGAIPGGEFNEAGGDYSFAAGSRAKATNTGAFVYSSSGIETASFADNSFTVRAPGGVRFITTLATNGITQTNGFNGVALVPAGTAWTTLSDSNAKTAIEAVDARAVLSKLESLPVTEWEYKHDPRRRYYGPMAQDFHAAFGLGNDDKTINTLDADGVLFLSVKGLVEELKERDKEIAELKTKSAEVDVLKKKLEMFEERLNTLPPGPQN